MRPSIKLLALVAIVFGTLSFALADGPQYTVVFLHPAGLSQSRGYGIGPGQQVGQAAWSGLGIQHQQATLWTGTAASAINLQPAGHTDSSATCTDGQHQAGFTIDYDQQGYVFFQAALWSGTAASFVSLHPEGARESTIGDVENGIEVGHVLWNPGPMVAGYWTGTAASFTQLPLEGFQTSQASGISGSLIVGEVGGAPQNACVWNISDNSFVNLHPSGYTSSFAFDTDGLQHTGVVATEVNGSYIYHAGVWDAVSHAFTDLNPAGWDVSWSFEVRAGQQVGYVNKGFDYHAALWNGTPESFVDLNQFLPPTCTNAEADGIAPDGTIIGSAYDGGVWKAVMWVPVATAPTPYDFTGFLSPFGTPAMNGIRQGRTLPVKFQIKGSDGLPITNATAHLQVARVENGVQTPIDVSLFGKGGNDGDLFRFDAESGQYMFNLDTKNLTPGTYLVTALIDETGQIHAETITVLAAGKRP